MSPSKKMSSPTDRGPVQYFEKKKFLIAAIGCLFGEGISPKIQETITNLMIEFIKSLPEGEIASYICSICKSACSTPTLQKVIACILLAVYMFYEICVNIYKWISKEITGQQCTKNIIDVVSSLILGIVGAQLGTKFGASAGPIGLVLGGIFIGYIGAVTGNILTDVLTKDLFDLPQNEAIEKAYNFLGVNRGATDEEVRNAYKEKLFTYHPDKGGSNDQFLELQLSIGIIFSVRL